MVVRFITYNTISAETPYEKGYCFVSYLQHLVGDADKFDNFLKSYVEKFQFKVGITFVC
jgi:aminopeptidase N